MLPKATSAASFQMDAKATQAGVLSFPTVDQYQARPAMGALRIGRWIAPRQVDRADILQARNWRDSAFNRCVSPFSFTRIAVCRPIRAVLCQSACRLTGSNTLAHKQVIQAVAYGPHHQVLSSSVAFAGSQTSEALNGRVPKSNGAFHNKEGELPNVCG